MTENKDYRPKISICMGYEGVFDEFSLPFLCELEEKLDAVIGKLNMSISEDVVREILYYAKGSLIEYSSRTMIYELNRVHEEYDDFCAKLESDPQEMYDRYPVLKDMMSDKIRSIADNIYELLSRLESCRENIRVKFGIDIDKLSGISIGQGDTHNHGRAVSILSFEGGEKLVYKPRNMQPEIAFTNICNWMNDRLKSCKLVNPDVLMGENFGFQEFMAHSECNSEDEVRNYYRRVGKAMAIFHLFDTSDLHGENIIPVGEYPIFTDLETLITVGKKKAGDKVETLPVKMGEVMEHSVFTTNLLPQCFKNKILDIDISGLGATKGQKSEKLKYLKLVDKGTTRIRYEEVYFVSEELNNVVRLNGEEVCYIDYENDIEEGFREAYDVLMTNKEELTEVVLNGLKSGRFRQVLRGTFMYERFLRASQHPKYLVSIEKTEELFNMLNKKQCSQGYSEVKQMKERDVPYFYAETDSRGLYDPDGLVDEEFFFESAAEKTVRNISGLSTTDRDRQLGFIRNSIMIAGGNVTDREEGGVKELINSTSDQMTVDDIMHRIKKNAVWDGSHKECSFIDVTIAGDRPVIGGMSYSLYDGMGLLLFLFAYARHTGKQEDAEFAQAALAGMETIAPMEKAALSTGVFSGFTGYIYLYYNLYKLTGEKRYYEKYSQALDRLADYDCQEEKIYDVIGGVSGAVIVLANIYRNEKDERLRDMIRRYIEFLKEKVDVEFNLWTGFAHGYAGIAYAFRKAYDVIGDKEYRELAQLMEKREDASYSEKQENWLDLRDDKGNCCCFWCHGAPGILMGRSYYMNKLEFHDKYSPAMKQLLEDMSEKGWNNIGDSMCHGRMGNIEIMNIIAENVNDEELNHETKKMMVRECKKIRKEGIEYGYPKLKGLMSCMVGLSGMGYAMLRMEDDNLPSVLGLEVIGE